MKRREFVKTVPLPAGYAILSSSQPEKIFPIKC